MKTCGVCLIAVILLFGCKKKTPAPLPVANFFVENNGCTAICTVNVYNKSTNAVELFWTFGNGLTSSKENETIVYDSSGIYTIWLFAKNTDGVSDSVQKKVTVF